MAIDRTARGVAGPPIRGMHRRTHVCVGWLVHIIRGHNVHNEPKSKLLEGARAPVPHAGYAPDHCRTASGTLSVEV